MKKPFCLIAKIFICLSVICVLFETNNFSFAGKNSQSGRNNKIYILDIHYIGFCEDGEPFSSYKSGTNMKRIGQELGLPVVGQVIKNKKVSKVEIYSDMTVSEDVDNICAKILNKESVFQMPACNLRIDVFFEDAD